jgi:hypothetical protein
MKYSIAGHGIYLVGMMLIIFPLLSESFLLNNNTFVFVSGWPQSGTSLINQILTLTPFVSTMVHRCNELIGDKCLNWNHEGQWLLPASADRDAFLNSGSMCKGRLEYDTNDSRSKEFGSSMISSWSQYWDSQAAVLVEKSPQSMLKSHLFGKVFREAKDIKFLIVLKHPATLNTATIKDTTWTTKMVKDRISGRYSGEVALDSAGIVTNAEYFVNFMSHDNSTNGVSNPTTKERCSLGWLDTMNYLRQQLQSDPESARSTRIIRYEYFEMPHKLCRAIFRFIFDDKKEPSVLTYHYKVAVAKVCDKFFPGAKAMVDSKRGSRGDFMAGKNRIGRKLGEANSSLFNDGVLASSLSDNSRSLRLRTGSDQRYRDQPSGAKGQFANPAANAAVATTGTLNSNTLDFQLNVVKASRINRFTKFRHMLRNLMTVQDPRSESVRKQLTSVLQQLEKYGYGYKEFGTFSGGKDHLSKWDIMNIEGKMAELL